MEKMIIGKLLDRKKKKKTWSANSSRFQKLNILLNHKELKKELLHFAVCTIRNTKNKDNDDDNNNDDKIQKRKQPAKKKTIRKEEE